MGTDAPASPPAGWYADPSVGRQWRYWDGTAWTAHVSPGLTPQPAPGTVWVPGGAARPPIDRTRLRPRAWWYGLAPIVVAAAVALAVLLGTNVVHELDVPIIHFQTPGSTRVQLDRGGGRTIYVQTRGSDLTSIGTDAAKHLALNCVVVGPGGSSVRLSSPGGSFDLTLNGDRYHAKLDFSARGPGRYTVGCADRADPARALPLAVGPRIRSTRVVGGVLGVLALLVGGGGVALGIVIVVALRRGRSRRELEAEAAAAKPSQ